MVSDVSAIDVASTTLRRPGGVGPTARSCSARSRRAVERRKIDARIADALAQKVFDAPDLSSGPAGRRGWSRLRPAGPSGPLPRPGPSIRRSGRDRDSGSRPERPGLRNSMTARRPGGARRARRRGSRTSREGADRPAGRLARRGEREAEIGVEGTLVELVEKDGGDPFECRDRRGSCGRTRPRSRLRCGSCG